MLAPFLDRDEREDIGVAARDNGFVEEVGAIRNPDECRGRQINHCEIVESTHGSDPMGLRGFTPGPIDSSFTRSAQNCPC